ncbi:MAG: hypothetical protein FAZ92_03512 [Accumulibacter sp.]|jgi:arginine exporter protein ArgO|uniref:hypothetical protein n=1 Tax=Accumulibacter sp. TaxID=2053492 RepID=UPI0012252C82|nr:hypothetical protein [Accumulibacter sp.]QKS28849.1 MAG: hypothetical protein HT579_07900 [Candidatus Accumulibacter similis]TLD44222.1 MAG: hypothetical protein FAZ92_03512 [Accumulibacter sp.]
MSTLAVPSERFPISEGVGLFVGIVAWDVLSAGEMNLLESALIAAAVALAWYAVRCWRAASRDKRR